MRISTLQPYPSSTLYASFSMHSGLDPNEGTIDWYENDTMVSSSPVGTGGSSGRYYSDDPEFDLKVGSSYHYEIKGLVYDGQPLSQTFVSDKVVVSPYQLSCWIDTSCDNSVAVLSTDGVNGYQPWVQKQKVCCKAADASGENVLGVDA